MPKPEERKAAPRSVRIRKEYLEQLGFTAGCPGCAWYSDKLGPHRGHTAECRKRMEEALHETEQGEVRMDIAKAKKDKHEMTKRDDTETADKGEAEKVTPEGENSKTSGASAASGAIAANGSGDGSIGMMAKHKTKPQGQWGRSSAGKSLRRSATKEG